MAVEIERKFLVLSDAYKKEASKSYTIRQGFLNSHIKRTVRVRVLDDKGFLTVKGISSDDGLLRFEWEKKLEVNEAKELLKLCEETVIHKKRYEVICAQHTYEIDEFFGDNANLVIAEIELSSKNESFERPRWLGEEVTGNIKYYNSQLSKKPYKTWQK